MLVCKDQHCIQRLKNLCICGFLSTTQIFHSSLLHSLPKTQKCFACSFLLKDRNADTATTYTQLGPHSMRQSMDTHCMLPLDAKVGLHCKQAWLVGMETTYSNLETENFCRTQYMHVCVSSCTKPIAANSCRYKSCWFAYTVMDKSPWLLQSLYENSRDNEYNDYVSYSRVFKEVQSNAGRYTGISVYRGI